MIREKIIRNKRYHKTPVRYGFENTEEPKKTPEIPSFNIFVYGDFKCLY